MHNKVPFIAATVCFCALVYSIRAEEGPIKALLVAGGCCHDYKTQKTIITEGISARANVQWVIANAARWVAFVAVMGEPFVNLRVDPVERL